MTTGTAGAAAGVTDGVAPAAVCRWTTGRATGLAADGRARGTTGRAEPWGARAPLRGGAAAERWRAGTGAAEGETGAEGAVAAAVGVKRGTAEGAAGTGAGCRGPGAAADAVAPGGALAWGDGLGVSGRAVASGRTPLRCTAGAVARGRSETVTTGGRVAAGPGVSGCADVGESAGSWDRGAAAAVAAARWTGGGVDGPVGAFAKGAVEVMGSTGTAGARCWSTVDRCTGMASADARTGVAARGGAAGPSGVGVGAGAVVGAGVDGVAAARAIGAPIGDFRDAVFVREAGAWAAAR